MSKNYKKVVSAAVVATMMVSGVPMSAQAADRDFHDMKNDSVIERTEYAVNKDLFNELVNKVIDDPSNLLYEMDEKAYNFEEFSKVVKDDASYMEALADSTLQQEVPEHEQSQEALKVEKATAAVVKAEESKLQADVDAAQALVTDLADGAALQARLDAIEVAVVGGLKVESVSAIDETGVTVTLEAMTEAVEGATINVVDPSGNVVAVSPLNLEIGDTEVIFNFATAYTAGNLPLGEFKVEGKTFDTAAVAAVADVNAAGNVVELWAALQSTYFTGVIQANIEDYDTALDGTQETVADIQTIIDEVNTASVSDEEEAAIVKTVADATNVLQLLNAIQDPAFVRVNADWITDYSTENVTLDDNSKVGMLALTAVNYFGETAGATIEGIQAAIDTENIAQATTEVGNAEGTLVLKDTTDARALVNAYVPADVEGQPAVKQPLLDRLEVHEAVVNVTAANTNAKLSSALNTLSGLSAALDITTVNSNELTRYRTDITAAVAGDKDSAADIQTLINTANTNAETAAGLAVSAVTGTTTTAQLKTLLTTLSDRADFGTTAFDIDSVVDALLEDYRAALVAETTGTNKDEASEIQGIIDGVNSPTDALDAVDLEAKSPSDATGDALLALLQVPSLKLTNLVAANAVDYLADVADFDAAITDTTSVAREEDAVKEVVNATNARVELNAATTKEAAKTALTKFAIATADTTYINLSSTGKLEVAALVLAERPATGYADNADVTSEISTQDGARTVLITAVNDAGPDNTNTITAMNVALTALEYAPYEALSAAEKVAAAEAFLNAFPMNDTPAQVNYTTITGIEAAIDALIAAQ